MGWDLQICISNTPPCDVDTRITRSTEQTLSNVSDQHFQPWSTSHVPRELWKVLLLRLQPRAVHGISEDHPWTATAIKAESGARHHQLLGKCKSKQQWGITSPLPNSSRPKVYKEEILERVWRTGNPCTPWLGMSVGPVTVENSLEVPKKKNYRVTVWFSNPTPYHTSGKDENSQSQRHIRPSVHSSVIYSSQDVGAMQVLINRWLPKEAVIDTHRWNISY